MLSRAIAHINKDEIISTGIRSVDNVISPANLYEKFKNLEIQYHNKIKNKDYKEKIKSYVDVLLNSQTLYLVSSIYIPDAMDIYLIEKLLLKVEFIKKLSIIYFYMNKTFNMFHLMKYFNPEHKKLLNAEKDAEYLLSDQLEIEKLINILNIISSKAIDIEELDINIIHLYYFQFINPTKFINLKKLNINIDHFGKTIYGKSDFTFNLYTPNIKYLNFALASSEINMDMNIKINQDNYRNLVKISSNYSGHWNYLKLIFTGFFNSNIPRIDFPIASSNIDFPSVTDVDFDMRTEDLMTTMKYLPNLEKLTFMNFNGIETLLDSEEIFYKVKELEYGFNLTGIDNPRNIRVLKKISEKIPNLKILSLFTVSYDGISSVLDLKSFANTTPLILNFSGGLILTEIENRDNLLANIKNIEKISHGNDIYMEIKNDVLFLKTINVFNVLSEIPINVKHVKIERDGKIKIIDKRYMSKLIIVTENEKIYTLRDHIVQNLDSFFHGKTCIFSFTDKTHYFTEKTEYLKNRNLEGVEKISITNDINPNLCMEEFKNFEGILIIENPSSVQIDSNLLHIKKILIKNSNNDEILLRFKNGSTCDEFKNKIEYDEENYATCYMINHNELCLLKKNYENRELKIHEKIIDDFYVSDFFKNVTMVFDKTIFNLEIFSRIYRVSFCNCSFTKPTNGTYNNVKYLVIDYDDFFSQKANISLIDLDMFPITTGIVLYINFKYIRDYNDMFPNDLIKLAMKREKHFHFNIVSKEF